MADAGDAERSGCAGRLFIHRTAGKGSASMLPKERVAATFRGEKTDRVPIYFGQMSSRVASAALGREVIIGGGYPQWREACALWEGPDAHAEYLERHWTDAIDMYVKLGMDHLRAEYWRLARKPAKSLSSASSTSASCRIFASSWP